VAGFHGLVSIDDEATFSSGPNEFTQFKAQASGSDNGWPSGHEVDSGTTIDCKACQRRNVQSDARNAISSADAREALKRKWTSREHCFLRRFTPKGVDKRGSFGVLTSTLR
jgi:hypothetical protein